MNDETIAALTAVNHRFYQERASEFSASRERPWSGWSELFERIGANLPQRPRVLDVGSGNGRFARFLDQAHPGGFTYWGVDASPLGLEQARTRLGTRDDIFLLEHDFISAESPLPVSLTTERFDLVVLFGVVHHVPGARTRVNLLQQLSHQVASGGILAYTLWRFDRHERFRKKLVPWPDFMERSGVGLDLSELEPGDHIVTWGGEGLAYRYCHAMSDNEAESLAGALPMSLVTTFEAQNEPNTYYALRSP